MRILRMPETALRVGLKRSGIYKLIAEGDFPRPVKLGARAVGFFEHEIDEWMERLPRSGQSHAPSAAGQ